MAQVTAQMVKELREATGAGPLDCKNALEHTGGDVQKALDYLREKGIAKANKKLAAGRTMNEGVIEIYQHFNKRMGVIVEVNCETDFVSSSEPFKAFARELAIHIVGMTPEYVSRENVPAEVVEKERQIQTNRAIEEGKPADRAAQIAEGRMNKFFEEICLLEQYFYKDEKKTIQQLLQETVATVGESIVIRRFSRYGLGENTGDSTEE